MIYRTTNQKCDRYKDYGGRGITVCERWKDFINFMQDMLPEYRDSLTIERIDNEKGYGPDNCKWVTMKVQNNNKRDSFKVEYNGQVKTITEWSELLKVDDRLLWQRIKRDGWTVERAFTVPVKQLRNQKNVLIPLV
jgi:hypothetical protein